MISEREMASADKGLEDRLRKIGDRLRSPATSVEELLPLLDVSPLRSLFVT